MSGFNKNTSTRTPARQHPDSMATEPVPILWEEVHLSHRRVSALRSFYLGEWLKETLRSWKSVFRRPGHMIPERNNRLQTR